MLSYDTNERKNLVIWILVVFAVLFFVTISIGLYLVSGVLGYVFWLAVLAHVQILSILAGLIAQLVKRRISISKDSGMSVEDLSLEGDNAGK